MQETGLCPEGKQGIFALGLLQKMFRDHTAPPLMLSLGARGWRTEIQKGQSSS